MMLEHQTQSLTTKPLHIQHKKMKHTQIQGSNKLSKNTWNHWILSSFHHLEFMKVSQSSSTSASESCAWTGLFFKDFILVTYFFPFTYALPDDPICVSTTFVEEVEPTPLFLFFSSSWNLSITLLILFHLLEERVFGFS